MIEEVFSRVPRIPPAYDANEQYDMTHACRDRMTVARGCRESRRRLCRHSPVSLRIEGRMRALCIELAPSRPAVLSSEKLGRRSLVQNQGHRSARPRTTVKGEPDCCVDATIPDVIVSMWGFRRGLVGWRSPRSATASQTLQASDSAGSQSLGPIDPLKTPGDADRIVSSTL
jgi:hypothetical protein